MSRHVSSVQAASQRKKRAAGGPAAWTSAALGQAPADAVAVAVAASRPSMRLPSMGCLPAVPPRARRVHVYIQGFLTASKEQRSVHHEGVSAFPRC